MLKYIPLFILLSSCSPFNNKVINRASFDPNLVLCEFIKYCNLNPSTKVSVYKGFENEINDPIKFTNRFNCNIYEFKNFDQFYWINDNQFNKQCDEKRKIRISNNDFTYSSFNENVFTLRISNFYYYNSRNGFFLASNICGLSCEEANIYYFEYNDHKDISIKLISPYFVT